MRFGFLGVLALAFTLTHGPAHAIGCFSGAVLGGIAGHMAHHGVIGALGGCVAGHEYNKSQQQQQEEKERDTHQTTQKHSNDD